MADIIKYDVRTYVQELIKKEFPFKNNEEKALSNINFSQIEIQQEEYHEIKHTRQNRRRDPPNEG